MISQSAASQQTETIVSNSAADAGNTVTLTPALGVTSAATVTGASQQQQQQSLSTLSDVTGVSDSQSATIGTGMVTQTSETGKFSTEFLKSYISSTNKIGRLTEHCRKPKNRLVKLNVCLATAL